LDAKLTGCAAKFGPILTYRLKLLARESLSSERQTHDLKSRAAAAAAVVDAREFASLKATMLMARMNMELASRETAMAPSLYIIHPLSRKPKNIHQG
jgi:hypothetical protein